MLGKLKQKRKEGLDDETNNYMLNYIDMMFKTIDEDGDGVITMDELVGYYAISILELKDDIEEL